MSIEKVTLRSFDTKLADCYSCHMSNNDPLKETIAKNIALLRERNHLDQRDLGLRLGYKEDNAQSRISQYEKMVRSPSKKTLQKMAVIFGVPVGDLMHASPQSLCKDVEEAVVPQSRVPLISWVRAGALHEPIDIYQAGFAEEWVASNASGQNAFALRVVGNSMFPEFLEGDIIVIDPGIEPASGDYAIVKVNDEVTFKQIHFYLNKIMLVPVNNQGYETLEITRDDGFKVQIIGKVVEQIRRR